MDQLLTPYDSSNEDHAASLPITRFDPVKCTRDKFFCHDFSKFSLLLAESLVDSDANHHFSVDWRECFTHPLIFYFNVTNTCGLETLSFLKRYFDLTFLQVLHNYLPLSQATFLLSMRRQKTGGMQVHVLNVELSHEDYLHLCSVMQADCHYEKNGWTLSLAAPFEVDLVASDRGTSAEAEGLFVPVHLADVEFSPYLSKTSGTWRVFRIQNYSFVGDTLFDRLTRVMPKEKEIDVARYLMPLPNQHLPLHEKVVYVEFPTRLSSESKTMPYVVFTSCMNQGKYYIKKGPKLAVTRYPGGSFCRTFLERHANFIEDVSCFETPLLSYWHKLFQTPCEPGLFQAVDQKLRKACVHLREEPSPLRALLESEDNLLPVYYALRNLYREGDCPPDTIAEEFSKLLPGPRELPADLPKEAAHLTFNTLLHCAFQTGPGTFLSRLGLGWDYVFESATLASHLTRSLRHLQKTFFPFKRVRCLDDEKLLQWDPTVERWLAVDGWKDIRNVFEYLYECVPEFFEGYSKMAPPLVRLFLNDRSWASDLAEEVLKETYDSEVVIDYSTQLTHAGIQAAYGRNVPEYHFFKLAQDM